MDGSPSLALDPALSFAAYEACGYQPVARLAVRVDVLHRIAVNLARLADQGPFGLPPELPSLLGQDLEAAAAVVGGLGYARRGDVFVPRRRERPGGGRKKAGVELRAMGLPTSPAPKAADETSASGRRAGAPASRGPAHGVRAARARPRRPALWAVAARSSCWCASAACPCGVEGARLVLAFGDLARPRSGSTTSSSCSSGRSRRWWPRPGESPRP